jgi:uncharacterized protein (DUF58 family)
VAAAPEGRRADPGQGLSELQAVTRYTLFATDHRLSQIGVLRRRRRGAGLEFQNLREYREGDAQRQVDWKASSRMGRLISREYQDERDQQIVLLLDCGRRMAARDGALSHLDHVLNSACAGLCRVAPGPMPVGLATLAGAPRWVPAAQVARDGSTRS